MTVGVQDPPVPGGGSVADLLAPYPVLDPPTTTAGAAVTIVLRDGRHGPEVLLIERAEDPSDPASGQVALPGGRVDERDGSLRETAVRELEEEVGLSESDLAGPPRFVRVLPAPRFSLHVGVFAAEIGLRSRGPTARNAREVAHVFWFPRRDLGSSDVLKMETARGPWLVPANRFEGHVLWGFTRGVLRDFFGLPNDLEEGTKLRSPSVSGIRGREPTDLAASPKPPTDP